MTGGADAEAGTGSGRRATRVCGTRHNIGIGIGPSKSIRWQGQRQAGGQATQQATKQAIKQAANHPTSQRQPHAVRVRVRKTLVDAAPGHSNQGK